MSKEGLHMQSSTRRDGFFPSSLTMKVRYNLTHPTMGVVRETIGLFTALELHNLANTYTIDSAQRTIEPMAEKV